MGKFKQGILVHQAKNVAIALGYLVIFIFVPVSSKAANDYGFFDSLFKQEFLAQELNQDFLFDYYVETSDNRRSYSYSLRFNKKSTTQYYMFGIVVAPAGQLLNEQQYMSDYQELVKQNADRKKIANEFPKIGKRCRNDSSFFGPGGSSYGLIFTTTDGLYDVKLVVSLLLPEVVQAPDIDIRKFAVSISEIYDISSGIK